MSTIMNPASPAKPEVTATIEATVGVVVVAPWHARLFLSDPLSTVEVVDRFPVVATNEPQRRFGRRRGSYEPTLLGFNWRIFSALRATVPDGLPIVLAGHPTFVSSFRDHAEKHGLDVAGVIEGVDGQASPTVLRSLAQAIVEQPRGGQG